MADKTKTSSEAKKQARERSILFDLPRLLLKSPSGMLGFIIVLVVVLISVFANVIIPCTPEEIDLANMAQPPCWLEGGSAEHILGTDILGRDVFSRILIGSRVSLLVGIFSVVVAGIIAPSWVSCRAISAGGLILLSCASQMRSIPSRSRCSLWLSSPSWTPVFSLWCL